MSHRRAYPELRQQWSTTRMRNWCWRSARKWEVTWNVKQWTGQWPPKQFVALYGLLSTVLSTIQWKITTRHAFTCCLPFPTNHLSISSQDEDGYILKKQKKQHSEFFNLEVSTQNDPYPLDLRRQWTRNWWFHRLLPFPIWVQRWNI